MAAPPQLRALLVVVNALLRKRRYHAALAVLKGFRNGAVYGAKIRAPHALVMTFLFRNGSLQEKLWAILQATYIHSWNLARFVFTYKGLRALQSCIQGKTYPAHAFLAAFLGGILVFGENNNINSQMRQAKLFKRVNHFSKITEAGSHRVGGHLTPKACFYVRPPFGWARGLFRYSQNWHSDRISPGTVNCQSG
ncbi:peroxisomal membrane protein 4 isoform X2 [Pongo pygmaeus]|uniref:peroxisomal membrane protein 4 isoform X2 n=1 Tax=Pongo abelii TaxID=9601 RepID=UPI000CEFF165|nr:peroxisomal membrane protein 4 isoform X2 [Pongo abelii]XP_054323469.1 peroxisomal membrane protein 4 isoform X2 [Pongo pygmaeus]